jgi:hypothetical protein
MGRRAFAFKSEHLSLMGKIPDVQLARMAKCSPTAVVNKRQSLGIPTYSATARTVVAEQPPAAPPAPEPVAPSRVKAALKAAVPSEGGMLIPFDQYALLAREFLA